MFCTVLHTLNSPQNVGMIVRSHAAHAGDEVLFTGHSLPWQFRKGSESFSRKLEKQATIKHIPDPREAITYLKSSGYSVVALEISENSCFLNDFKFPDKVALVVGNEASGLPREFLVECDYIVTIPQYSNVGSLNVAVSASIAMYELKKGGHVGNVSGDEYV